MTEISVNIYSFSKVTEDAREEKNFFVKRKYAEKTSARRRGRTQPPLWRRLL